MNEKEMEATDAEFYKTKMKAIRDALDRGDKKAANRHAMELKSYFNIE